jgi:hypothetical protein
MSAQTGSAVQEELLDALRRDGLAIASFPDLFGEELWAAALAHVAPFVAEQRDARATLGDKPEDKDDFIVRRYEHSGDPFSFDEPWLRAGLSDSMLGVVNAYRDAQTKLFYLDNWFTPPFPGADGRIKSQRWHRDPEEEHVVKVFLYLVDVDEETGPFEYVKGSPTGMRHGDIRPWRDGDLHPPDEEIAALPADDRVAMTGPAGTMFFCDTGGFHRGGFARAKPRVLSMWSFVSPDYRKRRRFEVDLAGREAELSADARAALA